MKVKPSTEESDKIAYEGDDNKTAWYIFSPSSRHQELAKFLELDQTPYCFGHNKEHKRAFVQIHRGLDERNGKVTYVEVLPEFVKEAVQIMSRKYNEDEMEQRKREDRRNMELARHGLL